MTPHIAERAELRHGESGAAMLPHQHTDLAHDERRNLHERRSQRLEVIASGFDSCIMHLLHIASIAQNRRQDKRAHIPLQHKWDEPLRAPHVPLVPLAELLLEDLFFDMDTVA